MKKILITLIVLVCLGTAVVLAISKDKTTTSVNTIATTTETNSSTSALATKENLEAAYNRLRVAIIAKDKAAFEANMEPAKLGAIITAEDWQKGVVYLDALYPDLSQIKFIKIVDKGEFAYYIAQTELTDTKSINVTAFKFHKVGGGWKLMGGSTGASLLKKSTQAENDVVLEKATVDTMAQIQ